MAGAVVLFFLMGGSTAEAQRMQLSLHFGDYQWEVEAKEARVEEHLGRPSLYLKAGQAVVQDSKFTDGVIEYDVAFDNRRSFIGAMWRRQDAGNYEEFYLRPHQSGNPDANQYTPVFNGIAGWQLYAGEAYGAAVSYPFNTWVHVKIVVAGRHAQMYIGKADQPILSIADLKREVMAGAVGFEVSEVPPFAGAHFSNFRYTPGSGPSLKSIAGKTAVATGVIGSWQVSAAFDEKSLAHKLRLSEDDKRGVAGWSALSAEPTGVANLARVQGAAEGRDTVFARATILSRGRQVKPLTIGFSNRVKLYLNDQLLYAGNDSFLSRDYRFLGTIGWFDTVYLPLEDGPNELWLAVTEDLTLGGWGVQARFDDMAGVELR